jgi:IclR family transcriptional regulator, acetate operon repressor
MVMEMGHGPEEWDNVNESVLKAVDVLGALAEVEVGLGARELSELVDTPRSTAQRLLQTLDSCDMVEQDPVTRRYRLGPRTVQLGMVGLSRVDVRTRALPYMTHLRSVTGETIGLNVRVGDARMYLEQLQSRHVLRAQAEVGQLYPLHSGAPGRVLLAFLDDDEIHRILDSTELVPLTGQTPLTAEHVLELVEQTRALGYAAAFQETIPGLNTIAVPVQDHRGSVVAGLSVSGPASRFDEAAMQEVRPQLLRAAEELSKELGLVDASALQSSGAS